MSERYSTSSAIKSEYLALCRAQEKLGCYLRENFHIFDIRSVPLRDITILPLD
jgi:hypothetical protein